MTNNATFGCNGNPAAIIMPNAKEELYFHGQKVLTEAGELKMLQPAPSQCLLQPNPAGGFFPCTFISMSVSQLSSGFSEKASANGSRLITDKATGCCPIAKQYGGKLSVKLHVDTLSQFLESSGKKAQAKANEAEQGKGVSGSENTATEQNNGKAVSDSALAETSDPARSETLACRYRCTPKEQAKCEELQKIRKKAVEFENDSVKLRENYFNRIYGNDKAEKTIISAEHKAHKIYHDSWARREKYMKDHELTEEPWHCAAHHILSGNEIVADMPALKALVLACDFDINCADNCIMLSTVNTKRNQVDPYGKRSLPKKYEASFEAMATTRLQWHVSKHDYKINEEDRKAIANALPVRHRAGREDEIKSYCQLMKNELEKEISDYQLDKICPKRDAERLEDFKNWLLSYIEEKRQLLVRFGEKPHRSFPLYVSFDAWRYAFLLPRVNKLVSICRKDKILELHKFRATRFSETVESSEQLTIKFFEKDGKAETLLFDPQKPAILDCVNFCENLSLFALGEGIDRRALGFEIPEEQVFRIPGLDDKEELKNRQAALLVWLLNLQNGDESGICETSMVRKQKAEAWFAGKSNEIL